MPCSILQTGCYLHARLQFALQNQTAERDTVHFWQRFSKAHTGAISMFVFGDGSGPHPPTDQTTLPSKLHAAVIEIFNTMQRYTPIKLSERPMDQLHST